MLTFRNGVNWDKLCIFFANFRKKYSILGVNSAIMRQSTRVYLREGCRKGREETMKKRTKQILRGIFFITLTIVLAFGGMFVGRERAFGEKFTAAKTVEKINDGLFIAEYIGDYGFDSYLRYGGGDSIVDLQEYLHKYLSCHIEPCKEPAQIKQGCSTVAVMTPDERPIFGRNYDWEKGKVMVVHTVPTKGYESVSTTALDFLNYGEDWEPIGFTGKIMSLASIYLPIDGMNEKGLVVADLTSGDLEETDQENGLTQITTTSAIRMMLDYAASVDEAIWLLEKCDMHSDTGIAHHYAISDRTGRSVVVEYIDNEMIVTDTNVVTNHYLTPGEKYGGGSEKSQMRYDRLMANLAEHNGTLDYEEMKDALESVSQSNAGSEYAKTAWSNVYHMDNQTVEIYLNENYEDHYDIELGKREWIKLHGKFISNRD